MTRQPTPIPTPEPTPPMSGHELRVILKDLRMYQRTAARLLDVDKSTVWRWVHGQSPIPAPTAREIRSWRTKGEA